MSKYIIEIKPEYEDSFKGVMLLGAKDSELYVDALAVESLEQYIPVDVEKIYDKAYGDGRKVGIKDGMCEAWEAVKKLYLNGACKGLFGECFNTFIKNHTAQEAIDKLKAYESKQKDRIEVGDEVVWNNGTTLTVTRVDKLDDEEWCDCMAEDGKMYGVLKNNVRKTGRHFDISSILEAMRS